MYTEKPSRVWAISSVVLCGIRVRGIDGLKVSVTVSVRVRVRVWILKLDGIDSWRVETGWGGCGGRRFVHGLGS